MVGHEVEGLEDDADAAAAEAGERVLVEAARSVPSTTTRPLSGRSSPAMVIRSVDLPEPGRADEADRLAAADRERDALEDMHPRRPAPEAQIDILQRDGLVLHASKTRSSVPIGGTSAAGSAGSG